MKRRNKGKDTTKNIVQEANNPVAHWEGDITAESLLTTKANTAIIIPRAGTPLTTIDIS